jgi:hypothetical protein
MVGSVWKPTGSQPHDAFRRLSPTFGATSTAVDHEDGHFGISGVFMAKSQFVVLFHLMFDGKIWYPLVN